MKATLAKILGLFFSLSVLMMMSCEGPEGPQGPEGPKGEDGKDMAINCMDCHDETTLLKAKMMQYENSSHYMGTSFARASSASCAACHSNEGFNKLIAEGADAVEGVAEPTPVACRTCHEIHETYTISDYALKGTADFNLVGDQTNNATVDMGKGNLCGKCHQTRDRGYGIVVDSPSTDSINISSSHWGPHYGAQTNILVGKGGVEIGDGFVSEHSHASLSPDGCVSCHANTGDHTFKANIDACQKCHANAEDFAYRGFQESIKTLIAELEGKLVAAGLLEVEHEGEKGHPIAGVKATHNQAGALFNYFLIYDDGSKGLHNPPYAKKLLENSIAVFN
jgi:hypothetical protein